jgi:hypothetical protein
VERVEAAAVGEERKDARVLVFAGLFFANREGLFGCRLSAATATRASLPLPFVRCLIPPAYLEEQRLSEELV